MTVSACSAAYYFTPLGREITPPGLRFAKPGWRVPPMNTRHPGSARGAVRDPCGDSQEPFPLK